MLADLQAPSARSGEEELPASGSAGPDCASLVQMSLISALSDNTSSDAAASAPCAAVRAASACCARCTSKHTDQIHAMHGQIAYSSWRSYQAVVPPMRLHLIGVHVGLNKEFHLDLCGRKSCVKSITVPGHMKHC